MDQKDFLAFALKESRVSSGISQEYLAFELGVARKTVQNWEKAISEPTIDQALCWFKVVNVSPLPYLFQYVYPNMEGINGKDSVEKLRDALLSLISVLPEEAVRQLLFLLYGDHGGAPRAVLNLMTAHLQTPLHDRVIAANVIIKNYEMAKEQNTLAKPLHVQPDIDFLNHAAEAGEKSAIAGNSTYAPLET